MVMMTMMNIMTNMMVMMMTDSFYGGDEPCTLV